MGTGSSEAASRERAVAEAALMARVAAGEREAPLIELYQRYATQVYRIAIQMSGDRHQAEDVVQETFVRLWRSAERFDAERSSVRTFVFLIARRVTIDFHRRAAARPGVAPAAMQEERGPARDDESDQDVERLVTGLSVRDSLDALPPKHREVLELAYDEDLSQSVIAQRLDLPLGTVKSRTYHALRGLRDELERRGIDG